MSVIIVPHPYIKKGDINAESFLSDFVWGYIISGLLGSGVVLLISLVAALTFVMQTNDSALGIILVRTTSLFAFSIMIFFWFKIASLQSHLKKLVVTLEKELEKYDEKEMINKEKLLNSIGIITKSYVVILILLYIGWLLQTIAFLIMTG